MTRKLYGAIVRCTWIGLYEWGRGWVSKELHDKFDEYWKGKQPRYYGYDVIVPPPEDASAISLYSRSYNDHWAHIYVHPQGFNTWITAEKETELNATITHLEIMCKEVAEQCGVKCTFNTYYPEVNRVITVNDKLL